ncbi:MAG: hypothetical protein HY610_02895 [Elusimicrobia bacterium]|nr:hypothetical protein [Elusimicrobiota bacterium]
MRKLSLLLFSILISPIACEGRDICQKMRAAWEKVESYQCAYQATTYQEGKVTKTRMRYTFQKPDKVRMDIGEPRKGAALLYNPKKSSKVKVRPFPKMPFFVLNYDLTDKRVSSDSGGTVEQSDLGNRIEKICQSYKETESNNGEMLIVQNDLENGKRLKRKIWIGDNFLPRKIEIADESGKTQEEFEWLDLNINPKLSSELFIKF